MQIQIFSGGWEWVGDQEISKFFGRTPIFDNFTM